jgi:NhaA family Na+:H+ antiporter
MIGSVLRGFQRFSHMEAAGGIVLIIATAVALVWANSPWADTYVHLWEMKFTVGVPGFGLTESLHHWINDGLMAVFFFLIGLEIKREVLAGELASIRLAALPVAAALGGMLVPAAFYVLFNAGGEGISGWGIPMATDIAFALGVLALLGSRVPIGLKVFLTALAIADDLGAVVVIALFYTASIDWMSLATGLVLLGMLYYANRSGLRKPLPYMLVGLVIWVMFLKSGVHATIAGVLLAMTIPVSTAIDDDRLVESSRRNVDALERSASDAGPLGNRDRIEAIYAMEEACEAALPPLVRIEDKLHGLVAFVIIPVFALANAGLRLDGISADAITDTVTLGIITGLVLGKPLGIMLGSWLIVRARRADLPAGTTWGMIHGVSWLAGIGFTMSLFIAGLAFDSPSYLESAKLGVLSASLLAGIAGAAILIRSLKGSAARV